MQEHAEELRGRPEPHCPACGTPLAEGVKVCPKCHHKLEGEPQAGAGGGEGKQRRHRGRPTLRDRTL
jgi:uncharacterized Zn finger protein (UPF0148 family)